MTTHHAALCIEPPQGILEELPAVFWIHTTGTAELVGFSIGQRKFTREDAVFMTGPDHVARQESDAADAYHRAETERQIYEPHTWQEAAE